MVFISSVVEKSDEMCLALSVVHVVLGPSAVVGCSSLLSCDSPTMRWFQFISASQWPSCTQQASPCSCMSMEELPSPLCY